MIIEQIYTGCLAQGAYYIQSEGEAAVIDPLREVSPYIQKAEKNSAKIKYVFETHFHADFVSGHVTLGDKTGAPIIYGPMADPSFEAHIAKDGEVFQIGKVTITVLHTPGHTMESTTYLLKDEAGKDVAIFSGDTLFLGDVGRPDLAQKSEDVTADQLAGILYDSLRTKIMPLADDVVVYPAHGAGSACGKNMMKETVDTLGNQKKMNYALRADMTKDEFIAEVTDGLAAPPAYFPLNVKLNKEGYESIDSIIAEGTKPLTPEVIDTMVNETDAMILDVRSKAEFSESHIPNSIFIGLDGSFAPWVGELIVDVKQAIILVVPKDREDEAVTRLARVGFDNTLGYLHGGIDAWKDSGREVDNINQIDAAALAAKYDKVKERVFDMRKENEYQSEHVEGGVHTPLSRVNDYLSTYPEEGNFFIHCASGYRSVIAASILKSRGYHNIVDILGGFKAIKETAIPTTAFVCPTTLK